MKTKQNKAKWDKLSLIMFNPAVYCAAFILFFSVFFSSPVHFEFVCDMLFLPQKVPFHTHTHTHTHPGKYRSLYIYIYKPHNQFSCLFPGPAGRERRGDAHAADCSGQPADGAAQHLGGWAGRHATRHAGTAAGLRCAVRTLAGGAVLAGGAAGTVDGVRRQRGAAGALAAGPGEPDGR